jgi:hypothetical protein
MADLKKINPAADRQTRAADGDQLGYQAPAVLEVFELEALAVLCTDTNAKVEVALGCNPGALFS